MNSENTVRDYHYDLIERCIAYLDDHKLERVGVKELSKHVGVSEYHLHRLFAEWAGITPDRFLRYLKKEVIKQRLAEEPLLDLAMDVGFGSPSRVHELLVTYEAMSPGELRDGGSGITIYYAFGETPFGRGFIAATSRGIMDLRFADDDSVDPLVALQYDLPGAEIREGGSQLVELLVGLFELSSPGAPTEVHLLLRGTNFQIRVWEALLRLPFGSVATYQTIARAIGRPTASRAVGNAVGANNIGFLIPCHRVIRRIGTTGEYQWGIYRKQAIIAWETAVLTGG